MKRPSKTKNPRSAESIARLADMCKDVSSFFTNEGRTMPPVPIDTTRIGNLSLNRKKEWIHHHDAIIILSVAKIL